MNKELNAPVCDATMLNRITNAGYIKKVILLVMLLLVLSQNLIAQYNPPGPQYPTQFKVALDGSGNFKTILEAVNSVRDLS